MDGEKTGKEAIAQVLRTRGDDGGEGGALQKGTLWHCKRVLSRN